jgi:hypothetical protein
MYHVLQQSVSLHFADIVFMCFLRFSLYTLIISLNSVTQLIFVMVKCGVFFAVWTGLLNLRFIYIFYAQSNLIRSVWPDVAVFVFSPALTNWILWAAPVQDNEELTLQTSGCTTHPVMQPLQMVLFWVVAPLRLVQVYWRSRGPYCLQHQGDRPQTTVNLYQSTRC